MRKHLTKFLKDLFMGPDGETWAIGRVYSLPAFLFGLIMIGHVGWNAQPPMSMTELGLGLAGVAAAVWALISGTNHVDNPIAKDA